MSQEWEIFGEVGLDFFGKITASISHEIKNVLAVINENAGLLEDFVLMAEEGKPLELDRLKSLAQNVLSQIKRADGIVNNLNSFANSVDESVKSVDLRATLGFVAALSSRLASVRGVTLETDLPTSPVAITTRPFYLKNLVWLCLDFAMDAAGAGKTVGLVTAESQNGAWVRFTRLEALAEAQRDGFPMEREKALLGLLKAQLSANVEAGELVITFPRDIGH